MTIHWTTFATAWGKMGVSWSERGVCGLTLPGESEAEIKRRLGREAVRGEEAEVAEAVAQVRAYFAGRLKRFQVAVDLDACPAFSRGVYEVLRKIPYGATMSYGEVAAAAGRPGAARAVGAANARNPVPLIIPCHRVVKGDGSLGGFSGPGGVGQKRRLLALEKKNCNLPGS